MYTIIDYVWIGGNNELHSKVKVVYSKIKKLSDVPIWTFDRSSTYQGECANSEGFIRPKRMFKCPFRKKNGLIVICDTYNADGAPLETNYRYHAEKFFEKYKNEAPWFGLEQEYFIFERKTNLPVAYQGNINYEHYCGAGGNNIFCRSLVDEHMEACIYAGVKIVGTNSEVSISQFEFQILAEGIEAADHLWVARYILEKLTEKYHVYINYHPKPLPDYNGSGCHINFSTKKMREKEGLGSVMEAINKIKLRHNELIKISGTDNELRLTGQHETSDYHKFSYGIGCRDTSIRIPNEVINNKCGYLEHRIYASNVDPYQATAKIMEIVME